MLAGINQSVFLQEWGFPEVELYLDRIQGLFKRDATFMEARAAVENNYTLWIYKKRNKVLFFIKGRMISHLSCTEFKERWKTPCESPGWRPRGKSTSFSASAQSLVA
jgi:hypothetical protein